MDSAQRIETEKHFSVLFLPKCHLGLFPCAILMYGYFFVGVGGVDPGKVKSINKFYTVCKSPAGYELNYINFGEVHSYPIP